jgi:hypothetical protein
VLLYIKETEFVYQVTKYNKLTEAVESYAELEKAAHTSTGLPVGAVIAIILVAIIALLGVAYVLLFFVFNRWIKNGEKAIRVVRLGKKGEQVRLLAMSFKVINNIVEYIFL